LLSSSGSHTALYPFTSPCGGLASGRSRGGEGIGVAAYEVGRGKTADIGVVGAPSTRRRSVLEEARFGVGESDVVRGVAEYADLRSPLVTVLEVALKSEEDVLCNELAEPIPLGVSSASRCSASVEWRCLACADRPPLEEL